MQAASAVGSRSSHSAQVLRFVAEVQAANRSTVRLVPRSANQPTQPVAVAKRFTQAASSSKLEAMSQELHSAALAHVATA
jgi:hypothetical protein